MTRLLALSLTILLWSLPAQAVDERKLVDLTYSFNETTQHWPTARPFHLEKISEGRTPAG